MVVAPLPQHDDYKNNSHRLRVHHHRHIRDSFTGYASNHSKQHYTYQYMSYNDNIDSINDTADHSITTSVSIRVTPVENYFVSWGILWSAFVVASIVAMWQVYREHRIFHLRRLAGRNTTTAANHKKKNRNNNNNSNVNNNAPRSTSSMVSGNSSININNDGGDTEDDMNNNQNKLNDTTLGDGESVSTADLTRSMVRYH